MLQFFSSYLFFLPCFLSNHPTTSTALQQAFQIIFSFPHKLLQLIIHPTTSSSFYFLILSCIRSPLSCSTNPPKIPQNWAEVGGGICRNSNHTAIYQSDPHFVCWLFSSNLIKYRGHVGGALARRSWPPMVIPLPPPNNPHLATCKNWNRWLHSQLFLPMPCFVNPTNAPLSPPSHFTFCSLSVPPRRCLDIIFKIMILIITILLRTCWCYAWTGN